MGIFSFLGQIGKPFEWLGRSAIRGWNSFGEFYGKINKKIKEGLEYVELGAGALGITGNPIGALIATAVAPALAFSEGLDLSFQGAKILDDKWNGNGERLNQIEKERSSTTISTNSTLPLPYIAPKVIGQGNLQIVGGGKNPYINNNVVSDLKPKNVISTVVNNSKMYAYM